MNNDYSKEDKVLILRAYRDLTRVMKLLKRSKEQIKIVSKAFEFSANAHSTMRRKSGDPYILHPIAVARICIEEIGLGITSSISALLHDTVEDTYVTSEDIKQNFGGKIESIIIGLTKISHYNDFNKSNQSENFKKMILTLPEDPRVIFIKLADRLHNMRTLDSMREDKRMKIASETKFLYAPLAHRLGLYNVKTELEDLCIKNLNPEIYENIQAKLNSSKDERQKYIRKFLSPLHNILRNSEFKNIYSIKSRTKSISSIEDKITNKNVKFEEIFDIFAIRIILDIDDIKKEKAVCWNIYSLVTDIYTPNTSRMRDWITNPRQNGYESLHITVLGPDSKWVEVQIRTKRMDDIAEKGLAAHWKYKEKGSNSNNMKIESWLNNIRQLFEDDNINTEEFIDNFKSTLYKDEIFVFTPKGDTINLPANSSILDFAFEIHTQVGYQCIGAKVNQVLVPISYKLKNGDMIEIIKSSNQKPKREWLNFTITHKAITHIKQFLNKEKSKDVEMGSEILERKIKSLKINHTEKNINEILKFFHLKDSIQLKELIYRDKINLNLLKEIINKDGDLTSKIVLTPKPITKDNNNSKVNKNINTDIVLENNESLDMPFEFSSCCNPIRGDKIFGFITKIGVIKIHRNNCPNSIQMRANNAYRVININWGMNDENEFITQIEIKGIDSKGIVNTITSKISNTHNINIKAINIHEDGNNFVGEIKLIISSIYELNELIKSLKEIDSVQDVYRVL